MDFNLRQLERITGESPATLLRALHPAGEQPDPETRYSVEDVAAIDDWLQAARRKCLQLAPRLAGALRDLSLTPEEEVQEIAATFQGASRSVYLKAQMIAYFTGLTWAATLACRQIELSENELEPALQTLERYRARCTDFIEKSDLSGFYDGA